MPASSFWNSNRSGIHAGIGVVWDAIKITTAKYYTPKGHYIHGKGIQPDIKLEYKYSGPEDESYDMKYDNQLQKAISVVKEKIN